MLNAQPSSTPSQLVCYQVGKAKLEWDEQVARARRQLLEIAEDGWTSAAPIFAYADTPPSGRQIPDDLVTFIGVLADDFRSWVGEVGALSISEGGRFVPEVYLDTLMNQLAVLFLLKDSPGLDDGFKAALTAVQLNLQGYEERFDEALADLEELLQVSDSEREAAAADAARAAEEDRPRSE